MTWETWVQRKSTKVVFCLFVCFWMCLKFNFLIYKNFIQNEMTDLTSICHKTKNQLRFLEKQDVWLQFFHHQKTGLVQMFRMITVCLLFVTNSPIRNDSKSFCFECFFFCCKKCIVLNFDITTISNWFFARYKIISH